MPFFLKKIIMRKSTLQVRIRRNQKRLKPEKRVSASAFSGSLSVEAAMVLPLFLFAVIILLMPLKAIALQRRMQAQLEAVCEQVSQYAYVKYQLEKNGVLASPEQWEREFAKYFVDTSVVVYGKEKLKKLAKDGEIQGLSGFFSQVLMDGEMIDLKMTYEYNLPFSVFRLGTIHQTVRSCRRAWIGRSSVPEEESGEEADDPIVYVGRDSTRYHCLRTCHYLANSWSEVSLSQIEEQRNSSGRHYQACSRCATGLLSGPVVYVTPNGTAYHGSTSCNAMVSYVREVHLSEVADLGACSYCGQ